MNAIFLSLKLFAATALVFTVINETSIATAQAQRTNTDDEIFNNIGQTWILNEEIDKSIYKDKNIQSEIMRIGISNACESIHKTSPIVLKKYEDEFKELFEKIVRNIFKTEWKVEQTPFSFITIKIA